MRTQQQNPRSQYLDSVFSKEDETSQKILKYSQQKKTDYMQISAYEAGILQFLCHGLKVKKAIEIGTLYGYSALKIAQALPEDGCLLTLDSSLERQTQAKILMQDDPHAKKIQFIHGLALDSLEQLKNQAPFDMIFIDADKRAYLDYLHWGHQHLKTGGLIIADNTFLFGAIYSPATSAEDPVALKVMKEFNRELAQSGKYTSTLIPTAEGLTVGIKN